jgi:hypothetical protein
MLYQRRNDKDALFLTNIEHLHRYERYLHWLMSYLKPEERSNGREFSQNMSLFCNTDIFRKIITDVLFLTLSSKIQVTLRRTKTFLCLVPVTYRQRVEPGALVAGNTRSA